MHLCSSCRTSATTRMFELGPVGTFVMFFEERVRRLLSPGERLSCARSCHWFAWLEFGQWDAAWREGFRAGALGMCVGGPDFRASDDVLDRTRARAPLPGYQRDAKGGALRDVGGVGWKADDVAVKITSVYKLKFGKVVSTNHSTVVNVETLKYKNSFFSTYGVVHCQDKTRPLRR